MDVGAGVGTSVGDTVDRRLGVEEGAELLGDAVRCRVGWCVGDRDGVIVTGELVGGRDGDDVGFDVGLRSMVVIAKASSRSSQDTNMWQNPVRLRTSAMHSS